MLSGKPIDSEYSGKWYRFVVEYTALHSSRYYSFIKIELCISKYLSLCVIGGFPKIQSSSPISYLLMYIHGVILS